MEKLSKQQGQPQVTAAWLSTAGIIGQIIGGAVGGASSSATSNILNKDYERLWTDMAYSVMCGGIWGGAGDYFSEGLSSSTGIQIKESRHFLQHAYWMDPAAAELAGAIVGIVKEMWTTTKENNPF